MPSSTLRHLGNQPAQSIIQPAFKPSYRPDDIFISSMSNCAVGPDIMGVASGGIGSSASTAWIATNRAIAVPFAITDDYLVRKVWWQNGATVGTDSFDVGVYTEAGARLVSGGGTLSAGANIVQEVDVTDTLLTPGRYWLAMAGNGTTATVFAQVGTAPANAMRFAGCAQMDTAYVLPTTLTPAAVAAAFLPFFGIAARTQVA